MGYPAPLRVWFNKPLSSAYNVFQLIRNEDTERRFQIYCTHPSADFIGFASSDVHACEPRGLTDAAYVDFALQFCREHGINVVVPGHRAAGTAERSVAFADVGVYVASVASAESLALLEDKAEVYRAVGAAALPVAMPEYALVQTADGFAAECERLLRFGGDWCIKPVRSMYGLGFRKLVSGGSELRRLIAGDVTHLASDHLLRMMRNEDEVQPLLLMRYLDGPERSVDCLARNGQLLACVVRRKSQTGGWQEIERNAVVEAAVHSLTAHFALNGLFNIQFKDREGIPHLLEINPRISGGLPFSALSGLNLPYWLLRVCEDASAAQEIPPPRTGVRFAQSITPVAIPA